MTLASIRRPHGRTLTVWGGVAVLTVTLALVTASTTRVDAHKAKVSPYAYNTEIFPILRDKCGRCHADGGPAPMSLMTYDTDGGAIAWAESMREMLLIGAMPPWYADPTGPAVRNHQGLSARELDTLITWIVGGTPHGDLTKTPPPVQAPTGWTMGTPDLALQMPEPYTLGAGTMQATTDVVIPTGLTEEKWVKAADVLPGVPTMVRRAIVSLEGGPVLALWEPGDEAIAAPSGAAFKLAAGAKLHLRIDYKKSWQDEQKALEDRTQVGLYFTEPPLSGKSIESLSIDAPAALSGALEPSTFSGTLAKAGRVVALRPMLDEPYMKVEITAIAASGRKVPLLKLRDARPEWPRRYWLVDPVELPADTKIEVSLVPGDPDSGPLVKPEGFPLQVGLDIVPQ